MNERALYQKELLHLRKSGLSTNYLNLKIVKNNKGYNFIIQIEEGFFNNRILHLLTKAGYKKNPYYSNKIVAMNMNEIIKVQSRGKVITDFNKTVRNVVFERLLSFEELKN